MTDRQINFQEKLKRETKIYLSNTHGGLVVMHVRVKFFFFCFYKRDISTNESKREII